MLALPAVAFVALVGGWPLAAILQRALSGGGLTDALAQSSVLELLWFTTWQAALSTALTVAAGLPLAWALARFSFPGRSLVRSLALVPFVLPTLVVAAGFAALAPDRFQGSLALILLAHVFFNVAVVVRIVGAAWEPIDSSVWDAAASLGAGPLTRFRTITLPLLRPALAAASSIAFLFCFTSFGVILVLGGARYATLETEIYNSAVRLFDLRTAALLALVQLAAVAVIAVAAGALERRLPARPARRSVAVAPVGQARWVVAGVVTVSLALLALPALAVMRQAFVSGGEVSLAHFGRLFEATPVLLVEPWRAAVNSLLYAGLSTAAALALGVPAAVAIARGGALVNLVLMLPLGVSAAMLGLGFLLAFDEPPLDLRGSRAIVPLAQALVILPFVVRALAPPLRALDPHLREAAATLGADTRRQWRTIDLPLLRTALAAAAGLGFAVALGEFGATVFLARADTPTLPVAIFRFLGRPGAENVGTAAALSVVLMTLVVLASLVGERGVRPMRNPQRGGA